MSYRIILIANIIVQWVGLHCRLGGCFTRQPANKEDNEIKKTISSSFVPLRFSYGGPSSAVGVRVKGLSQIETGHMHEDKI